MGALTPRRRRADRPRGTARRPEVPRLHAEHLAAEQRCGDSVSGSGFGLYWRGLGGSLVDVEQFERFDGVCEGWGAAGVCACGFEACVAEEVGDDHEVCAAADEAGREGVA